MLAEDELDKDAQLVCEYLPPELLITILSFLENKKLKELCRVNKTWKTLINHDIFLGREIEIFEKIATEAGFTESQVSNYKMQLKQNFDISAYIVNECKKISKTNRINRNYKAVFKSLFNKEVHLQAITDALRNLWDFQLDLFRAMPITFRVLCIMGFCYSFYEEVSAYIKGIVLHQSANVLTENLKQYTLVAIVLYLLSLPNLITTSANHLRQTFSNEYQQNIISIFNNHKSNHVVELNYGANNDANTFQHATLGFFRKKVDEVTSDSNDPVSLSHSPH